MKRIIYGSILLAILAAVWIFLANPPTIKDQSPSTALDITFRLSEGYEFTEGAPFVLTWQTESQEGTPSVPVRVRSFDPFISPFKLAFKAPPGSVAVILNARLYYCDKISRMCFQDDFRTRIPLVPGNTAVIPRVWEITPKKA